jgi:zinc transporter 1
VMVSAAIMSFTSLPFRHLADPLASLIISALLAPPAWRLVRSSAAILLQRVPTGVDVPALRAALLELPGVVAVHDLHVWALRPGVLVGGVHIGHLGGAATGLCDSVKRVFHATGVHASTVQLELVEGGELPSEAAAAGPELCEDLVCSTSCEAAACCPT